MLVQIDRFGVIRDLCYPTIGFPNHLNGNKMNLGFYCSEGLSWINDGTWATSILSGEKTPTGHTKLTKPGWSVEIEDAMDAGRAVHRRRITIHQAPAGAKLYATSHFDLHESDIGNTVYFAPNGPIPAEPGDAGMVHYKGHLWIYVALPGATEYACGHIGFGGFEGTPRDAEDGHLSQNAIAQGSVDATQGRLIATGDVIDMTIMCAHARDQLRETEFLPQAYPPVPEKIRRSLGIIMSKVDLDGAIIAANDSDIMQTNRANYGYCWMRDGALVASVLGRLGIQERVDAFLGFCDRCYEPDLGFFLQKYRSDATVGASWHPWTKGIPFQEDETASALSLACGQSYPPDFAAPALAAILKHIDPATGLPLPSFDLWEERFGVHTYTTATVIRALRDAAAVMPNERSQCLEAADRMTQALRRHLFDQQRGVFYRRLDEKGEPDGCVDASSLFVVLLGILEPDDPLAIANLRAVEKELWIETPIGGLARYDDDYYFRRDFHLPGNPWIITTLWLARSCFLAGNEGRARELLEWTERQMTPSGILPEQIDPHTGEHLSVSPLTWSHAEYIETVMLLS